VTPFYEDESVTLYCGDSREVLPLLADASFDLVVTSPPYNLGVSSGGGLGHYCDDAGMLKRGGGGKWNGGALAAGYGDYDDAMPPADYESWQRETLTALWRLVNERGAIYYNHKPRVQGGVLWTPLSLNPGLPLRQIVIWARAGGVNFSPTFYVPTHEWILVFGKPDFRLRSKGASGVGDVWMVAQESGTKHPAPFPETYPVERDRDDWRAAHPRPVRGKWDDAHRCQTSRAQGGRDRALTGLLPHGGRTSRTGRARLGDARIGRRGSESDGRERVDV
jgi:site-specific DNA-methyltransferase (adenine-specific)